VGNKHQAFHLKFEIRFVILPHDEIQVQQKVALFKGHDGPSFFQKAAFEKRGSLLVV
jgi:hypothetical protein